MLEVEVNNISNLYVVLEFFQKKNHEIGKHLNFQNTETNCLSIGSFI